MESQFSEDYTVFAEDTSEVKRLLSREVRRNIAACQGSVYLSKKYQYLECPLIPKTLEEIKKELDSFIGVVEGVGN